MVSFWMMMNPSLRNKCFINQCKNCLVGGFNPIERYERQIGSFPQGSGWKWKNIWNIHVVVVGLPRLLKVKLEAWQWKELFPGQDWNPRPQSVSWCGSGFCSSKILYSLHLDPFKLLEVPYLTKFYLWKSLPAESSQEPFFSKKKVHGLNARNPHLSRIPDSKAFSVYIYIYTYTSTIINQQKTSHLIPPRDPLHPPVPNVGIDTRWHRSVASAHVSRRWRTARAHRPHQRWKGVRRHGDPSGW